MTNFECGKFNIIAGMREDDEPTPIDFGELRRFVLELAKEGWCVAAATPWDEFLGDAANEERWSRFLQKADGMLGAECIFFSLEGERENDFSKRVTILLAVAPEKNYVELVSGMYNVCRGFAIKSFYHSACDGWSVRLMEGGKEVFDPIQCQGMPIKFVGTTIEKFVKAIRWSSSCTFSPKEIKRIQRKYSGSSDAAPEQQFKVFKRCSQFRRALIQLTSNFK